MPMPAPRITWTRRRLAVIVSTVLVLVLAGAVSAPDSDGKNAGVSLSAPIQVGEPSMSMGFTIPVGAEAHMTVVGDLPGGKTSYCTSGRYYWRFDAWSSWSVSWVSNSIPPMWSVRMTAPSRRRMVESSICRSNGSRSPARASRFVHWAGPVHFIQRLLKANSCCSPSACNCARGGSG